jgi:hypothetical protein
MASELDSPYVTIDGGFDMDTISSGLCDIGGWLPKKLGLQLGRPICIAFGFAIVYLLILLAASFAGIKWLPGSRYVSGMVGSALSVGDLDRVSGGGAVLGHASMRDDTGAPDGSHDANDFLKSRRDGFESGF